MVKIRFDGSEYELSEDRSVLDGLLDQGIRMPYSCKSGTCQTCMVQADRDAGLDPKWQTGLKATDKARGYVLACQCRPVEGLALRSLALADSTLPAEIVEKRPLGAGVMALHLRPLQDFTAFAGQYVTLFLGDGTGRSYSIANIAAEDGFLELHVRRIPGGRMSGWIHDDAAVGDRIMLRGPAGNCFYVNEAREEFPILLAGTGTGLAPLLGVARDALRQGHRGEITLIHGALRTEDLYFRAELTALAAAHTNFRYVPCVLEAGERDDVTAGSLDQVALGFLGEPRATRVYFCGAPEMVALLKRKAFLAGVASRNIFSDPFIPTATAAAA